MKVFASLVITLSSLTIGSAAWAQSEPTSESNTYNVNFAQSGFADVEIPGKVLLRNKFSFKGGRKSEGASSSLVLKDGKVYLLTAKHLLGEAMGISPEVRPSQFNNDLRSWKVMHNDSNKSIAKVTGIHKPNDNLDEDVIVLKTNANFKASYGYSLDVATKKPEVGDKLYVIGCPYDLDTCVQRAYAGVVNSFTNFQQDPDQPNNLFMLEMIHTPIQLAGFSGAAVVNEDMKMVALVVGGSPTAIAANLLPDWFME